MKLLISSIVAFALGTALGSFSVQAATPVTIANESFEGGFTSGSATSGTGIWVQPNGWTLMTPGGEARSGWSMGGQSPASPNGGGYWSLEYVTGWTTFGTGAARFNATGIQQTISGLTIGDSYELSFYSMANAPSNGVNGDKVNSTNHLPEFWRVSFGGQVQDGATVYSDEWTIWKQSTLNFTATQTSQVLSFAGVWLQATPGVTPTYLNLDGVKLSNVTPVPEPAALSLWMLGLGAVAVVLTRRRSSDAGHRGI